MPDLPLDKKVWPTTGNQVNPKEAAYIVYARIYRAKRILAIVNSKAKESGRAISVCLGLLKTHKTKILKDTDIMELSDLQKKDYIDTTDLVITFGFDDEYSDVHCFILDLKNSGAITIGINDIRNNFTDTLDLCMVDRMPGFMRTVVQLCKEAKNDGTVQDMAFR